MLFSIFLSMLRVYLLCFMVYFVFLKKPLLADNMKKILLWSLLTFSLFSIVQDTNAINSWGGNTYPTFPYISGSLNLSTPLPVTTASGTVVNSYGLNSSGTMISGQYYGQNRIRINGDISWFSQVVQSGQFNIYAMDFAVDFTRSANNSNPYIE